MLEERIHEHLTRLGRLLQAEVRADAHNLQPVQLHALDYLSRCNRYSDRPAAVAEYLGITKGTASQTLRVLEQRGLIAKHADPDDRRIVHLSLTAEGRGVVETAAAKRLLARALEGLPPRQAAALESSLSDLLTRLQRQNGGRAFGLCRTCRHFLDSPDGRYRCGLTTEPLSLAESELICREHEGVG